MSYEVQNVRVYEELIAQATLRLNLAGTTWVYRALPVDAGVYALIHRESGKLYIGSAAGRGGIRTRVRRHRRDLRHDKHGNQHLQAYHDKYGMEAFDVLILEITDPDAARSREQYYLETFQPWRHGFNATRVVDQRWSPGPAAREAAALKASKPFELEFNGEVFSGVNLTAFCREKGLHQGAMTQVLLGQKIQFKGWTLPGKAQPVRKCKYWPTGEIVEVPYYEGTKFAKSRGLDPCGCNKMLSGTTAVFKGWSLSSAELDEATWRHSMADGAEKSRVNGRQATATTQKGYRVQRGGKVYEGLNRSAFCRAHGLSIPMFITMCNGKRDSVRGFTRADDDVVV